MEDNFGPWSWMTLKMSFIVAIEVTWCPLQGWVIVLQCSELPLQNLQNHLGLTNWYPTLYIYVMHQNPLAENVFKNFSSVFKAIPINCKYGRADDLYNQYVSWSGLLIHVFSVCEFFFSLCLLLCYLYWQKVLVLSATSFINRCNLLH
jgi:hypothetical protein